MIRSSVEFWYGIRSILASSRKMRGPVPARNLCRNCVHHWRRCHLSLAVNFSLFWWAVDLRFKSPMTRLPVCLEMPASLLSIATVCSGSHLTLSLKLHCTQTVASLWGLPCIGTGARFCPSSHFFLRPQICLSGRFRWAREGRICSQKFLHFPPKKSGQKRPKTASSGVGSSVGCCSLSALVPLWALNAVNPYTQSYGPLSGGFVPCKNSTQKWLHALYTLSFTSLKLLTPRSVQCQWMFGAMFTELMAKDALKKVSLVV